MPLLEGLDGKRKMSKSLGNYVGITEAPAEMFGKLMSIPDEMMLKYFEMLTDLTPAELKKIKSGGVHPMESKKRLADIIVSQYHGEDAAEKARKYFETKFQQRQVPDNVPVFKVAQKIWICELMKQLRFTSSTSEARRLIGQGGVRVDGATVTDFNFQFTPGEHSLIEVGKRKVARITP